MTKSEAKRAKQHNETCRRTLLPDCYDGKACRRQTQACACRLNSRQAMAAKHPDTRLAAHLHAARRQRVKIKKYYHGFSLKQKTICLFKLNKTESTGRALALFNLPRHKQHVKCGIPVCESCPFRPQKQAFYTAKGGISELQMSKTGMQKPSRKTQNPYIQTVTKTGIFLRRKADRRITDGRQASQTPKTQKFSNRTHTANALRQAGSQTLKRPQIMP